jgi:hypothetical protein
VGDGGFNTGLVIGGLVVAVVGPALALILTSGDGDDEGDTTMETVAATTTAPTAPTTTPPTTAPPTSEGGPTADFRTPSGNIACFMSRQFVNCVIAEADWQPPGDPSCPVSAGRFVAFEGDTPTIQCGNPSPPSEASDVLPYGQRIVIEPYRCTSQERGVTCDTLDGTHRVFLSRERFVTR